MRANATTQRICAYSGPLMIVVFCIGMIVAGILPPPSPDLGPHTFRDELISDTGAFRAGLLLAIASSGLYAFFSAGVAVQLKRVEGPHSPMTYAQLVLGGITVLLVIFPLMWLLTAAYRDTRSDDLVQLLGDMAFFPFVGAWMTVVFQWIATAIAIFNDDSPDPVFPRWAAYFNLWVAVQSIPSTVLFFVHDGPFAWNGVLSYWLALTAFAAWILVMTALLLRAIDRTPATIA